MWSYFTSQTRSIRRGSHDRSLPALQRLGAPGMTLDIGPLATVAAATGFTDQSHLCRVFKSLLGCTPVEFRGFARYQVH